MMLADDPGCTLIEPVAAHKQELPKVYEGELMLDGGHIAGWAVEDPALIVQIEDALAVLGSPVSYTHLDVYKRQPASPCGTLPWCRCPAPLRTPCAAAVC